MKIFAISDTHFGHDELVKYGRPVNFSSKILTHIKKQSGDVLIHCGDFCIGDDIKWHDLFMSNTKNFKKRILIRGNHDNKSYSWYYKHGWDFVCDEIKLKMFGKVVLFTHKPIPREDKKEVQINIHGHLHGNDHRANEGVLYLPPFHQDMSVDIKNYRAVDLSVLITKIIKQYDK